MDRLDYHLRKLEIASSWLGKLGLVAMMMMIVSDVAGRYLLSRPIPGVYEITEFYFMIAVVFLGLSSTQRDGVNVRVELVLERLPAPVQRGLEILFLGATLLVFFAISYLATRTSVENFVHNRWTTGVVQLPLGPSWGLVAIGCVIFCLRVLLQFLSVLMGRSIRPETVFHD
jgi:TRAP-type C4-dicarboxylate transport system permease small subunit